ncbi:hypothetical protein ACFXG4_39615 [Nocardia sp. NPDC059246]|uniref:hypothetical protein n=1 Tax=unclassified Nocardia TaxID=2637762 RepID=UPI0036CAD527
MTELILTDERRTELAALLDDEARLRAEYPVVADYLSTAPMLAGTGDERSDAAFDLRLVHYLTGGESATGNPYWDIVSGSVFEHDNRRMVSGGRANGSSRLGYAQTVLQAAYAYAIPSPETIGWVSQFCSGRTIVELGAGRGYWAAQLARAGLTVEAYDSEPPDTAANPSFPDTAGQQDVWFAVGDLDQYKAQSDDQSERVLFLCWPPGWGSPMASEALAEFEHAGGNQLVFIGEPKGGKTGDDAFFDVLAARWELETQDPQFVSWWNLSDVAQGWTLRP